MSRICTVCASPDRATIDQALVAGEPNRRIATRSVVSEAAIRRHKAEHLPERMAMAKATEDVSDADALVREVKALRSKAYSLLLAAEKAGDLRTALLGVREARSCLELLGELQGAIERRGTVNLTISPEWLSIRAAILGALVVYPAARVAVADRLVALEAGRAGN